MRAMPGPLSVSSAPEEAQEKEAAAKEGAQGRARAQGKKGGCLVACCRVLACESGGGPIPWSGIVSIVH